MRKGAEKLTKFLNAKQQGRLDGFFTASAKPKTSPKKDDAKKGKGKSEPKGTKRKVSNMVISASFCCMSADAVDRPTTKARRLAAAKSRRSRGR